MTVDGSTADSQQQTSSTLRFYDARRAMLLPRLVRPPRRVQWLGPDGPIGKRGRWIERGEGAFGNAGYNLLNDFVEVGHHTDVSRNDSSLGRTVFSKKVPHRFRGLRRM